MSAGKRKGAFSVIFVPSGGAKPRTITLSRRGLWAFLASAAVVAVLVVFSVVVLAQMGWFSFTISRLRRENTELKEEHGKVARLEQEMKRLGAVEKRLLALLGVDSGAKQSYGSSRGPSSGGPGSDVSGARAGAGTAVTPNPEAGTQPRAGRAAAAPYARSLPTLWPVLGEISRTFSYAGDGHKGLDIATPNGTQVRAAGDGTVEFAGPDDVFGLMIIINHGSGITTLYGHNSKLAVARGDEALKGQVIAYSGTSGKSSAPHLHFEISRYGRQVNPLTFLSERE
jgi:murein DD-endopeptidase MepM/ murein hydrolase activator NlpD